MPLIFSADFEALPIEPIPRWLKLRDLLERRLIDVTDSREGVSEEDLVEYCMVLVSAAEELELGKFEDFSVTSIRQHFPSIRSEIIALATKLSMKSSTANAAFSVALPRKSKARLYSEIERLRTSIVNSELSEQQKQKLFAKLNELHTIIVAPRADFAKMMTVVASIAAIIGGATAFLADAPDALTTIAAIVGEAKEDEEEEHRLLQAEKEPLKLQDLRKIDDLGEDVPF